MHLSQSSYIELRYVEICATTLLDFYVNLLLHVVTDSLESQRELHLDNIIPEIPTVAAVGTEESTFSHDSSDGICRRENENRVADILLMDSRSCYSPLSFRLCLGV